MNSLYGKEISREETTLHTHLRKKLFTILFLMTIVSIVPFFFTSPVHASSSYVTDNSMPVTSLGCNNNNLWSIDTSSETGGGGVSTWVTKPSGAPGGASSFYINVQSHPCARAQWVVNSFTNSTTCTAKAYIPLQGTVTNASYDIRTSSGDNYVSLNQNTSEGWTSLGSFYDIQDVTLTAPGNPNANLGVAGMNFTCTFPDSYIYDNCRLVDQSFDFQPNVWIAQGDSNPSNTTFLKASDNYGYQVGSYTWGTIGAQTVVACRNKPVSVSSPTSTYQCVDPNGYPSQGINYTLNACHDSNTSWGFGFQCVELVKRYASARWNVSSGWGGNASTLWDTHPSIFQQYPPGSTPHVGDIVVFSGGGAGHTAIVTYVSGSTFQALEQNGSSTGWGTYQNSTGSQSGLYLEGFLRGSGV
jgi:surface antigen